MKNLKKVLSLVLALAMALSLMTVAFAKDASDYADYDKVTNKEAVSVLTTLEVIDGMGGSFNPTGNVTRAQMAKMITIISLGNVDATAFLGTKTDLKDINGHWAEAYIKYCYSQGIISGRGNGIFDPNANVTAVEAAKDRAANEQGVTFLYPHTKPFQEACAPMHEDMLQKYPDLAPIYDAIQAYNEQYPSTES